MSITAFPVLVRILTEHQLFTTKVGAVSIACAAVGDITAWCLLAFVVAISRAQGLAGALWTTALALAFVLIMFQVVRPWLRLAAERVVAGAGLTPSLLATTLLLLILSSTLTDLIGIHALFGAFLFGAIFPKWMVWQQR